MRARLSLSLILAVFSGLSDAGAGSHTSPGYADTWAYNNIPGPALALQLRGGGGGNAQKSAVARDKKNAAKAKERAGGGSTLKTKDDAMIYQCKVCKQTFMCTATIEIKQKHVDNKHKGKSFEDCFNYTYVAAPGLATVWQGPHRAHAALGSEAKKGFPKDRGIEEFDTKEEAYAYIKEKIEYINDDDEITYVDTD